MDSPGRTDGTLKRILAAIGLMMIATISPALAIEIIKSENNPGPDGSRPSGLFL